MLPSKKPGKEPSAFRDLAVPLLALAIVASAHWFTEVASMGMAMRGDVATRSGVVMHSDVAMNSADATTSEGEIQAPARAAAESLRDVAEILRDEITTAAREVAAELRDGVGELRDGFRGGLRDGLRGGLQNFIRGDVGIPLSLRISKSSPPAEPGVLPLSGRNKRQAKVEPVATCVTSRSQC